jgi:phenazine biosynthesis protein phzE
MSRSLNPFRTPAETPTHMSPDASALQVLAALAADPAPPPFALLLREDGPGVELLTGDVLDVATLADLPLPASGEPPNLALVPFRQVAELGFAHHDDGTPLRVLRARRRDVLTVEQVLSTLPAHDVPLSDAGFDMDDDRYADLVKRVISDEIGHGEGANFVLRRDLCARQPLPPASAALAVFRCLLEREHGSYWVFAVHAPDAPDAPDAVRGRDRDDVTMVGATPERHVSSRAGTVVMNPISGTFHYPAGGPTRAGLLDFLRDRKEVEELFMVIDEELKMMSALCDRGGRVLGPFLKPMGNLAHTEYLLTGRSDADPRHVLRATMFAATVSGSPLENACRVIARHERTGRGYYAGMAALLSDGTRGPELDAPILIRTAYLGADGSVRVPVGATLVRHSVPETEVAETYAKSAGILSAFAADPDRSGARAADQQQSALPAIAGDLELEQALAARNTGLSRFWLDEQVDRPDPRLAGHTALVVDAEDSWTEMLAHVLTRLGMRARVVRWDAVTPAEVEAAELLVAGPGPGDPRDLADRRMAGLHGIVAARTAPGLPLLAVCLSHQIVAAQLGLPLEPLPEPYQGTQRRVRALGRDVRVGFYNTYTARARRPIPGIEVWTDGADGEVVALRTPGLVSVQFHLESILSADGVDLLAEIAADLLHGA